MIDIVLLIGRLLFVALLYLVSLRHHENGYRPREGTAQKEKAWSVAVEKGPKELRGATIDVHGPIVVGRSPGADIVIGAEYVSSRHARFVLMGQNLFIEDMGSLNGTAVNGMHISEPTALKNGDRVMVGDVTIRVRYA